MTDPVAIDRDALERLRDWGGEKLVGQMLRLFLENSLVRMEQIRTGVTEKELDKAEMGAHSLKSSAANVGAAEVRRIAAEMETKAIDDNLEALQGLLPQIEDAYQAARAELEAIERGS